MGAGQEQHEFQAEVKQLLDLVIHSLYTNKDIFLRELISNSSDALDKRRLEGLTRQELLPEGDLKIFLESDSAARTLTVSDNGIGMSRQEVVDHIGTIARSGTREFLKEMSKRQEKGESAELIGQFGVGFYSCFMVAEKVVLETRKAGEEEATRWESGGGAGYLVQDVVKSQAGTRVTVHLKPEDSEDGLKDYTSEHLLRSIVKKYSDFVAYPIRMTVERKEGETDAEGRPREGAPERTVLREDTLNSMKAIWTRPRKEVTDEEYKEFYRHVTHDWNDPLETISAKLEGTFEAQALLFIPSKAPFDLYQGERTHHGIQLYVKRVFIMDDCRDLMPDYLRFVRGMVDSEALSLNISREMLQQDRQIRAIRGFLVKKVLETFKEMKDKRGEQYLTLWKEFGVLIKQGLLDLEEKKDRLLGLMLYPSSHDPKELTSLQDYLGRMKEGQEAIYYLTGPSPEAIEHSPHLEAFGEKGFEVLYWAEPVDEVAAPHLGEFEGHKFQSVGKGEVDLSSGEEKKQAEEERKEKAKTYGDLMVCLRSHLQENVKEVRLSKRLTASAVCLVGESHDLSPMMEEILKRSGQPLVKTKRILELNPGHPLLGKLQDIFARDPKSTELKDCARLLHGQALLAEGSPLEDPAGFSKLIAEVMTKAI